MNKTEIIKGKMVHQIPQTQWRSWYDEIIPNGEWNLSYINETDTKATQIYEKDGVAVQFEFTVDNEEYTELINVLQYK